MAIADFIEPAIKDFATQATATYSAPINTNVFMGTGTGANPFVTRELVYNKIEWNGYAKHVCEQATDMIMADLKLLGNRG